MRGRSGLLRIGLARRADVLLLQEVHGKEGDLSELQRTIPKHKIYGTFCDNSSAGGVAIIINPRLLGRYGGEIGWVKMQL